MPTHYQGRKPSSGARYMDQIDGAAVRSPVASTERTMGGLTESQFGVLE
jgi:hypothetical protein